MESAENVLALLSEADNALEQRNLPAAEALFRGVLAKHSPDEGVVGHAAFGLASVLQLQGKAQDAQAFFSAAANKAYRREAALRSLAQIAGALGSVQEQAIYAEAADKEALDRASRHDRPEASAAPASVRAAPQSGDSKSAVLVQLLRAERGEAAEAAVRLIEKVRADRAPFLSAYLGVFLRKMTAFLILEAVLSAIHASGIHQDYRDIVAFVAWAVLVYYLVTSAYLLYKLKTTRFEISEGRIIHHVGGLSKKAPRLEIFRAHNFEPEQTLLNRLTGDGTVICIGEKETSQPTIMMRGFVKKAELDQLCLDLRDLNRALRATSTIRGIIK